MHTQIRQIFHPSHPPPLRILTRVTSLKQVMYDFGQRPPIFTCVGTLWLVPNKIHFTCFCFDYCSSTPDLHSQFDYYEERGEVAYFFC